MKIKKLCAVALLLLLSFYAKAQNWQAYKGVWLKGYDNATQAPVPPSGYSALTYFADSLGTYVYDWDSLAWLRIPGAGGGGGGGGGLVTADNGLNVNTPGNVRLGGPLSTYTTVSGGLFKIGDPSSQAWLFSNSSWTGDRAFGIWVGDTLQALVDTLSSLPSMKLVHHANSGTSNLYMGDGITQALRLTVVPFVKSSIELGLGSIGNYSSISTNSLTGGLTMASDNDVRLVSRPWSPTLLTELKLDNNNAVLSSSSGSQINFDVASPTNAIISTANQLTFNAGSTSGNLSKATFTPTSLQLEVTNNSSFSNTFDLNATSWNLNIPSTNFSANATRTIWTQGSGVESTSIELRHSTETAELRSTEGSQISFDVAGPQTGIITFTPDDLNSTNGLRINNASTNNNANIDFRFGGTAQIGIRQGDATSQMTIRNNAIISGGGADFTIGTSNGPSVIYFEGGTSGTIVLERTSGPNGTVNIFGGGGQAGTSEAGESILIRAGQGGSSGGGGGDMTIRGGSGGSAGAAGGDTFVLSGQGNGGGPDGNIIIDALTGFLILSNLPTSNPCGSAPTGTVWSDSGTLKVCP